MNETMVISWFWKSYHGGCIEVQIKAGVVDKSLSLLLSLIERVSISKAWSKRGSLTMSPKPSMKIGSVNNALLLEWAEWIEILRGFTKFFFKQILNVSAFYLKKQKIFIPPNKIFKLLSISKQKSLVYWPNFQWRIWLQFAANCLLETGGFQ